MMTTKMALAQAKDHLADLLAKAAEGEDVVIVRDDGSAFTVVPTKSPPPRKRGFAGSLEGKIWIADDFDEIPEGFEDYMPEEDT